MNEATLTILINGIMALIGALPGLAKFVENWDGPAATKEELLARIKTAQESIPEWK